MPLPLAIPFLIKGAVVVGKVLFTKAAVAKSTAAATKALVTHYGAATVTSAAVTGLVCVGGIMWSMENINRLGSAYNYFSNGDYGSAASELTRVAASIKAVGASDYVGDLHAWIASGKLLDSNFAKLIKDGKALADEAAASLKLIE